MNLDAFQCQRCGACCRIPGVVKISDDEIETISVFLDMDAIDFIDAFTDIAPSRQGLVLKDKPDHSCIMLTPENTCRINPVKPHQCRDFPFSWTNPDSQTLCHGLRLLQD